MAYGQPDPPSDNEILKWFQKKIDDRDEEIKQLKLELMRAQSRSGMLAKVADKAKEVSVNPPNGVISTSILELQSLLREAGWMEE